MKSILNVRRWLIPTIAPLLCVLAISGCSAIGKTKVSTVPVDRTPLSLSNPDPLSLDFPQWIVVTPNNVDEVWKKLEANNQDIVLFALTAEGYEQLIVDLTKIKNLINEQKIIILEYKKYYEPEQKK